MQTKFFSTSSKMLEPPPNDTACWAYEPRKPGQAWLYFTKKIAKDVTVNLKTT
jgi:hypothetical protein